ncbi:MAG: DNA recombination protein RmuC [Candidatus Omnitrophica bacterium]|nr:DNA recombination protein RmuC [Candidatus Omnitrophota bacterium]
MSDLMTVLLTTIALAAVLLYVRGNLKSIGEKNRHISELQDNIKNLTEQNSKLMIENAQLKKEKEAFVEKISWTEKTQEQLKEAFSSLATQVLRGNAEDFLKSAKQSLESIVQQLKGDWGTQKVEMQKLVEPLSDTLKKMDEQVRAIETSRERAYEGLKKELQHLFTAQDQLRMLTVQLNQALKSTEVRGQWGQIQLRRVVELAGMTKHVDYEEQVSTEEGRPDMIVHLPNGGIIPVDAKSPMVAYLEAINAEPSKRQEKMTLFAKKIKETIGNLASKKYWAQFNPAPDVVIMFVPNEASISAAYEVEPGLLEYAIENHVLIATPVTLLGLLKAVAFGWQQHSVEENAIAIAQAGRQLYERMAVFIEHLRKTGRFLDSAAKSYNESIASLESRLIPSIRRLQEFGSSIDEIESAGYIDTALRLPDNKENSQNTL